MKLTLILLVILFLVLCLNNYKIERYSNMKKDIIIVGNAPYNEQNPKGDLINSFDNVVRFNNFNISKKHQKYIGNKTDYWCMSCFVYHSNKKLFNYRKDNVENIMVLKPKVFLDRYPIKPHPKVKSLIQDKDIKVPSEYNFGKNWPSTGLLAVFYFLQKYPRVYVTGFNHFDKSKGSIHYYESLKQIGHKSDLEKDIFNDLKLKGKVIYI